MIQHLIAEDRSITELARRRNVTQPAASKAVGELIGLRILEATSAKDRRAKSILLTCLRALGGMERIRSRRVRLRR